MPADALEALRSATASRHTVLDSRMPLARVQGGSLPSGRSYLRYYRDHLRLLRAWLTPLEAWLAGYADGPFGQPQPNPQGNLQGNLQGKPGEQSAAGALPLVRRLPAIEADLGEAGMPAADSALAFTEQTWPGNASPAFRWGASYVVEGSQLGAAVLYRRLAGPLAPHPLRYLQGEGPPGPRWQAFIAALRAQVRTPGEIAEARAGACAAFDRLLALLQANPALAAPPPAGGSASLRPNEGGSASLRPNEGGSAGPRSQEGALRAQEAAPHAHGSRPAGSSAGGQVSDLAGHQAGKTGG